MPFVSPVDLQVAIQSVFEGVGASHSDAAIVAEHLVDAELSGVTSHGVIRVPQYLQAIRTGKVDPRASITIIREDAGTAILDGGNGLGQVMAFHAMEEAIRRAGAHGIASVALTRVGHTGRLASYAEQAAKQEMIGMVFVNGGGHGQWMAPFGGSAGRLATNPMAVAIPTSGDPLVVDIATSVAPEGKVRVMQAEGKTTPDGWLVDSAGRPTNDPNVLYAKPRGALLPFGGHKGFGLALIIDALAGGLSGSGCCVSDKAPMEGATDGVLLITLDIARFGNPRDYRNQTTQLLTHVKSSPLVPGVAEILAPGELEHRRRRQQMQDGFSISSTTWEMLLAEFASVGATVKPIS
jgi:hydroxycarboxylate dehydrogenase B